MNFKAAWSNIDPIAQSPPHASVADSISESLPPDQQHTLHRGTSVKDLLKLLEQKNIPGAREIKSVFESRIPGYHKGNVDLISEVGGVVEYTRENLARVINDIGLHDDGIRDLVLDYVRVLHKMRAQAAKDESKLKLYRLKMASKMKRMKMREATLRRITRHQSQLDPQVASHLRDISDELVQFSSFAQGGFTSDSPYLDLARLLEPIIVKSQDLLDKHRNSKKRTLICALAAGVLTTLFLGCAAATGPFFPITTLLGAVIVSLVGYGGTSALACLFQRQNMNYKDAEDVKDHVIGVKEKLEDTKSNGGVFYNYVGLSASREVNEDARKEILQEYEKAVEYLDRMIACVNALIKSVSKPVFKPSNDSKRRGRGTLSRIFSWFKWPRLFRRSRSSPKQIRTAMTLTPESTCVYHKLE
eukprot:1394679-Amorphochlora_amoeboformis.AAC.1